MTTHAQAIEAISSSRPSSPAAPSLARRAAALVDLDKHLVGPRSRPEYGEDTDSMKVGTNTQVWDRGAAIDFVADAFLKAYPAGAAKRVANDVGVPHRTAEKWMQRENAPSLHQFLNAVQRVPELKAAMRELLDMGETNPRFARAMHDFIRAAQEMR